MLDNETHAECKSHFMLQFSDPDEAIQCLKDHIATPDIEPTVSKALDTLLCAVISIKQLIFTKQSMIENCKLPAAKATRSIQTLVAHQIISAERIRDLPEYSGKDNKVHYKAERYTLENTPLPAAALKKDKINQEKLIKLREKQKLSTAIRKAEKEQLSYLGLSKPEIAKSESHQILSLMGNDIRKTVLYTDRTVRKTTAKPIRRYTGSQYVDITVKASTSGDRIMHYRDYQNAAIVRTLVYLYQVSRSSEYLSGDITVRNITPIHLGDILSFKNHKKSGTAYDALRNSLASMDTTYFEHWIQGELKLSNQEKDVMEGFLSYKSQIFKRIQPLSKAAPKIVQTDGDNSNVVLDKSVIYLVELNDDDWDQITSAEALPALPLNALRIDTILFAFYEFVRRIDKKLKRGVKAEEKLSKFIECIDDPLNSKYDQLIENFENALDTLEQYKDPLLYSERQENGEIIVNLWGYHCQFNFFVKDGKKQCEYSVVVNAEEQRKSLLIFSEKQSAPTIVNEFYQKTTKMLNAVKSIRNTLKKELNIVTKTHHIEYEAPSGTVFLSRYSYNEDIYSAIDEAEQILETQIGDNLVEIMDQLELLYSGEVVIARDVMHRAHMLLLDYGFKITIIEFVEIARTSRKLRTAILNLDLESLVDYMLKSSNRLVQGPYSSD